MRGEIRDPILPYNPVRKQNKTNDNKETRLFCFVLLSVLLLVFGPEPVLANRSSCFWSMEAQKDALFAQADQSGAGDAAGVPQLQLTRASRDCRMGSRDCGGTKTFFFGAAVLY